MHLLPRLLLALGLLVGLAAPGSAAAPEKPAPRLPIGMNLTGISDYEPGFPFKNLMWGARPWHTKNLDDSGPYNTELAGKLPLDSDGYPLELPYTPEGAEQPQYVFTLIPNTTPAGRHVLLYDGEGEIVGSHATRVVSSAPGRVVLELKNAGLGQYEGIAIRRSKRGDHVRNIRILALADEKADLAANPFRPEFVDYCRQWHVLRFMDWAATNNSLEGEWSERKPPTFYTMIGEGGDTIGRWSPVSTPYQRLFSGGVAIEHMIHLANLTKTDPWFCMPHRATPEYMSEFAKLVKAKLDPSLTIYVEYSNEVWNWQFQQAQWMLLSRVAAEPLAGGEHTGWKDGVPPAEFPIDNGQLARDGGADHPERTAVLARRAFSAWENVFTGPDRARIVRVVGVQGSWPDTARRLVEWVMAHGGADAMSPTGYFGPNDEIYAKWEAAGASLTADQVVADMRELVINDTVKYRELAGIAREHKLRYVVYEGGQHIQPKDQKETPYLPALKAAQFHPGLAEVYMLNFAFQKTLGVDLFCAFASVSRQGTRWGSWGHQEYYGQPRSEIPKYGALLDANAPRPAR